VAIQIKVLKEFTEQRSGRTYKPGDVVTDESWLDPGDRRAEAYAARGYVEVVEMKPDEPEKPAQQGNHVGLPQQANPYAEEE
jgi:hypothetical protein